MAHDEDIDRVGYGFNISGAILMSNRETKTECLKRKLFGLPASMALFIKKIKAGMLLFLFEHEERKLYGVFEATCDGALNIVPDAFTSSGRLFPAQILFKRIWMCKPLSEDEFRDAIKENYYKRYKFHFHLSNQQVSKLLHLFSKKKINLELDQGPVMNHMVLKHLNKPSLGKFKRFGSGRYMKFSSNEHNWHNFSSRSPNASQFLPYSTSLLDSGDSKVDVEHGFYSSVPGAPELHQLNLMNLTLQNDQAPNGNVIVCPTFCRQRTFGSKGELSLAGENIAGLLPSLESQAIQVGNDLHQSQSDPAFLTLTSSNCNCTKNVSTNLRTQYVSSPNNEPLKTSSRFMGSEPNNDSRDESLPFPDHYDPSDPAMFIPLLVTTETNDTDFLSSMPSSSSGHCNLEASQQKDGSRIGDLKLEHCADFIPLPEDDDFVRDMECSPTSGSQQKYTVDEKDSSDSKDNKNKCYPASLISRLHSDCYQERKSVFTRLS